jgi:hypothetical protein
MPRSDVSIPGLIAAEWFASTVTLERDFAWPAPNVVQLDVGQNEYAVSFVVRPVISARGALVSPQGGALAPISVQRLENGLITPTTGNTFVVKVPKGVGSWLCVGSRSDLEERPVFVPASSEDVDLGSVTIPTVERTAKLNLTVNGRGSIPWALALADSVVTLVREPGDFGVSLAVEENGRALIPPHPATEPTAVAPGSYWVVPGDWTKSPLMIKVLNLLRANRGAELQQAGVPKVVLTADQTTTSTVDAADTITRILGIAE